MKTTNKQQIIFIVSIMLCIAAPAVLFSQIPAQASILTLLPLSPRHILLEWTEPAGDASVYVIYRRGSNETSYVPVHYPADHDTTWVDENREPEITYTYVLYTNSYKALSKFLSVTTPPEPDECPASPRGLRAAGVVDRNIFLSWTDQSYNESGFIIERAAGNGEYQAIGQVFPNVTAYNDSPDVMIPGTTYLYRVTAYNSKGPSGPSEECHITIPAVQTAPPAFPPPFTVQPISAYQILLSVESPPGNNEYIIIQRKTTDTPYYTDIAKLAPGTTTYVDKGLMENTTYMYRIYVYNTAGYSGYSGEEQMTTFTHSMDPPAPPTYLVGHASSPDRIELSWTDNGEKEWGYIIRRIEHSGQPGDPPVYFSDIALVYGRTSWADTTVKPGTGYEYRVCAFNTSYINENTSTLKIDTPPVRETIPEAPDSLRVSTLSLERILIEWQDKSINEYGFIIERKVYDSSFVTVGTCPPGTEEWTDKDITPSTQYTYRIRSFNTAGQSKASGESTIISPGDTGTVPSVPGTMTVQAISPTKVEITWYDNAADEYGYVIEQYRQGTDDRRVYFHPPATPGTLCRWVARNLEPDSEYSYRFAAWNSHGISDYSPEIYVTTDSLPGTVPSIPVIREIMEISPYKVHITWDDLSHNEEGFIIQRRKENGTWELVHHGVTNTRDWIDRTVTSGTTYTYMVAAYNALGLSTFSNMAAVTTSPAPLSPSLSTITITPPTLRADGRETGIIDVVVKDIEGYPSAGNTCFFQATGSDNYLPQPGSVTDAAGTLYGKIVSRCAEEKIITVTINRETDNVVIDAKPVIRFTPGKPAALLFTTAPQTTLSGAVLTPAIELSIVDACGNIITDARDPVYIDIGNNPSGGVCSGTMTVLPSNGRVSFSDLQIDKFGTGYTLIASSGSLPPAESSPFSILPYHLGIAASGGGTTSPSGTIKVSYGETMCITAQPDTGYHFKRWIVDAGFIDIDEYEAGTTELIIRNSDAVVRAEFEINTYTITASAGTNGVITPDGESRVTHGDTITHTIIPDQGYMILDVLVDGISRGDCDTYTFTGVADNHTISASFELAIPTEDFTFGHLFPDFNSGICTVTDQFVFDNVSFTYTEDPAHLNNKLAFSGDLEMDRGMMATFKNFLETASGNALALTGGLSVSAEMNIGSQLYPGKLKPVSIILKGSLGMNFTISDNITLIDPSLILHIFPEVDYLNHTTGWSMIPQLEGTIKIEDIITEDPVFFSCCIGYHNGTLRASAYAEKICGIPHLESIELESFRINFEIGKTNSIDVSTYVTTGFRTYGLGGKISDQGIGLFASVSEFSIYDLLEVYNTITGHSFEYPDFNVTFTDVLIGFATYNCSIGGVGLNEGLTVRATTTIGDYSCTTSTLISSGGITFTGAIGDISITPDITITSATLSLGLYHGGAARFSISGSAAIKSITVEAEVIFEKTADGWDFVVYAGVDASNMGSDNGIRLSTILSRIMTDVPDDIENSFLNELCLSKVAFVYATKNTRVRRTNFQYDVMEGLQLMATLEEVPGLSSVIKDLNIRMTVGFGLVCSFGIFVSVPDANIQISDRIECLPFSVGITLDPIAFMITLPIKVTMPGQAEPLAFSASLTVSKDGLVGEGNMTGTWKNPFGLQKLEISDVTLALGISWAGVINQFAFAGTMVIPGPTQADNIILDIATQVTLPNVTNFALIGKIGKYDENAYIGASDLIGIVNHYAGTSIGTDIFPDMVQFRDLEFYLVPSNGVTIGTTTYDRGFRLKGGARVTDIHGNQLLAGELDTAITSAGLSATIDITPFKIGSLTVTGLLTNNPKLSLKLTRDEQSFLIDGAIHITAATKLGLSVLISSSGIGLHSIVDVGPISLTLSGHFKSAADWGLSASSRLNLSGFQVTTVASIGNDGLAVDITTPEIEKGSNFVRDYRYNRDTGEWSYTATGQVWYGSFRLDASLSMGSARDLDVDICVKLGATSITIDDFSINSSGQITGTGTCIVNVKVVGGTVTVSITDDPINPVTCRFNGWIFKNAEGFRFELDLDERGYITVTFPILGTKTYNLFNIPTTEYLELKAITRDQGDPEYGDATVENTYILLVSNNEGEDITINTRLITYERQSSNPKTFNSWVISSDSPSNPADIQLTDLTDETHAAALVKALHSGYVEIEATYYEGTPSPPPTATPTPVPTPTPTPYMIVTINTRSTNSSETRTEYANLNEYVRNINTALTNTSPYCPGACEPDVFSGWSITGNIKITRNAHNEVDIQVTGPGTATLTADYQTPTPTPEPTQTPTPTLIPTATPAPTPYMVVTINTRSTNSSGTRTEYANLNEYIRNINTALTYTSPYCPGACIPSSFKGWSITGNIKITRNAYNEIDIQVTGPGTATLTAVY